MSTPIYFRALRENKPSYILGISESHTATAALLKNGQVIACASEERFTRQKLAPGIPKAAIAYCLRFAKIDASHLSKVAIADITPPIFGKQKSQKPSLPSGLIKLALDIEEKLEENFPITRIFFYNTYKQLAKLKIASQKRQRLKKLQKIIPLPDEKFIFIEHHRCHAAAGLFSSPFPQNNVATLVLTVDGVGDFESATVSIFKNNRLKKLASADSQQSLGFFYQHITQFLGMKPLEDEYKVMGLAPYTQNQKTQEVYNQLRSYFKVEKSKNFWQIKVSVYHLWRKLPKLLAYKRFDHIAAATQKILEQVLTYWIKSLLEKYKIKRVVCSGGVFANVKANQKIASLKGLKNIYFMPSPGDESNAIGAAYYYHFQNQKYIPSPLSHLYLGPEASQKEIASAISSLKKQHKVSIQKPSDINLQVAKLLSRGEVVARFAGRMEFGARALGNRSILANPSKLEIVSFINSAIKNRDFWMPFAPTILAERAQDYLIPHKAQSLYMNVAYQTTQRANKDLAAAIHPADKSTRPQILTRETNPSYYDLLKKFEKLTGIGAVLNTSFNLHGEPIVCTPQDAIKVFKLSGLKFLAMENWLISKE